jgi:hypothetical protein
MESTSYKIYFPVAKTATNHCFFLYKKYRRLEELKRVSISQIMHVVVCCRLLLFVVDDDEDVVVVVVVVLSSVEVQHAF